MKIKSSNSNLKIIIIIISAIVLLIVGIVFYRAITKFISGPAEVEANNNVTLVRFYLGKTIEDSDLNEIKEIAAGAVGANKILAIKKGDEYFPRHNNPRNEDGERIEMGDGAEIIFSVLTDEEKIEIFNALADKYGITQDYFPQGLGRDIYRSEFDN